MKKKIHIQTILFFLLAFAISCVPVINTINTKNYASLYNPGASSIHPTFQVFNTGDSLTNLYVKLYTQELLFTQTEDKVFKAKVKITYKIYQSIEQQQLIDSASTYITIKRNNAQEELATYIQLKPIKLKQYVIEILTTDLQRNRVNSSLVSVDKNIGSEQNFLLTNIEDYNVLFYPYFIPQNEYVIQSSTPTNNLTIKYYNTNFLPSMPPFSTTLQEIDVKPDSIWVVPYGQPVHFKKKYKGLYFIQTDTALHRGLTKVNFGSSYPQLKTPTEMIAPLRFLTTSEEYKEIVSEANKKFALDNFWLKAAGTPIRAKDLIRIYYNRITFANIYFTSYTEGWKTDRGMIYTIFGPPKTVSKYNNKEKWIYNNGTNLNTSSFTFVRLEKSLSENDYILQRSVNYKDIWYKAVETWRSGKVFSY